MGLTLSEIQAEVSAWSARNFPANTPLDPLEGLIEELGECAHARLKGRQGIRHTPEECVAMERDAIGDMGVYLCDFAGRSGIDLRNAMWRHRSNRPDMDPALAFAVLAKSVGSLIYGYHDTSIHPMGLAYWLSNEACTVAQRLDEYSRLRGWDFLDILNETWAKVSRRDWRAMPMEAGSQPGCA